MSVSFIATLDEAQRAAVEAEVRTLLTNEAEIVLPYRTDVSDGAPLARAAAIASMGRLGDDEQVVGQRPVLDVEQVEPHVVIEREVAPPADRHRPG